VSFQENYSGIDYFRSVMAQWGLDVDSLISWADEKLRAGESVDKILFDLERRPEFDAAFPEIKARRERALATGIALAPIGPAEILQYRTQGKQLMRSFGLPDIFYDENRNFFELIVNDVSLDELNSRLELSANRVVNAPPEVRQTFEDIFGNAYDADRAMYLLFTDPDKALPTLEEMVQTAEAGGAARRLGFGLSRTEMERLAGANLEYDQLLEGFGKLDVTRGLFDETLYETDFEVGREGIEAAFGLAGGAQETLTRRGEARRAETMGAAGAGGEERGLTGLGEAGQR
jgi:hypothetical protein